MIQSHLKITRSKPKCFINMKRRRSAKPFRNKSLSCRNRYAHLKRSCRGERISVIVCRRKRKSRRSWGTCLIDYRITKRWWNIKPTIKKMIASNSRRSWRIWRRCSKTAQQSTSPTLPNWQNSANSFRIWSLTSKTVNPLSQKSKV